MAKENTQKLNIAISTAVNAAINGDWQTAHNIAQNYEDNDTANWLHAVLHKMEGDISNSKYWYSKTQDKGFEDFADISLELKAILQDFI